MARIPRRLLPDGVYHVTTRGVDRCPIYGDDADRVDFLSLLAGVVHRFDWDCHALCLMGNHYHVVVETPVSLLSLGMHRLNGPYAEGFNAKYGRTGHLFGDRFVSRVIGDEEDLVGVCRYVVLNPVRAGLCERPADWPWSGCRYGLDDL